MRVAILTGAGAAILAVAGCGGSGDEPSRPQPRVRLEISKPADLSTVHRETVDVRGHVSPTTADVRVLGRPALVSGGSFTVLVRLDPGVNVIDVAAAAIGRRPALTAFRVTRDQRVTVPDLSGVSADELETTLRTAGLVADITRGGGLLDQFVPSGIGVCQQDPEAGTHVRRGTTVHVVVARAC
ncbi:MAG: hypothetical protein QOG15_87 [Solirubrobacteraceae bacterium]|nr:hypothetical protein [Solirubrobacteraceae bacterium]